MVGDKKYFTINRGRQYGKMTILTVLAEYQQEEYTVVSMDFQAQLRFCCLRRRKTPAFQSVIPAGVYDI